MKWTKLANLAVVLAVVGAASLSLAQSRSETLLVVTELGPNSMDIHGIGANRPAYQASWNLYDRLMTYGVKPLPDGTKVRPATKVRETKVPEVGQMGTKVGVSGTKVTPGGTKVDEGTKVLGRPKQYASAAERKAAYRARQAQQ